MTQEQIATLVQTACLPGGGPVELIETHISWVLLNASFAFKLKKPLQFSFLDYSTLELREQYCREELRLNRRLAPDMYLDVLPVGYRGAQLCIDAGIDPAIDWAVQMRRMDNTRQLDRLLQAGAVRKTDLEHLARVLAPFHQANVLHGAIHYDPKSYLDDFSEIFTFENDILKHLGRHAVDTLRRWQTATPAFLSAHTNRLLERVQEGFWVDGHGDLHARNIFLTENGPVVFDCIEFNPHFRQVDVLSELAFLCMDLEYHGRADLETAFLQVYQKQWEVMPLPEDVPLFIFLKAYRAAVRLKVALLELRQHTNTALTDTTRRYWSLLEKLFATIG